MKVFPAATADEAMREYTAESVGECVCVGGGIERRSPGVGKVYKERTFTREEVSMSKNNLTHKKVRAGRFEPFFKATPHHFTRFPAY